MRSLFLRFFIAFWLLIGLIAGGAAISGFLYAERLQATIEDFEVGSSMAEANAVLAAGGRDALADWIRHLPRDDGVIVYIVDADGRDIVGRELPFVMQRYFQRHRAHADGSQRNTDSGTSRRRHRVLPQLIAPNGEILTMLVAPVRRPDSIWRQSDERILLLAFALVISGLLSYALAMAFSRPVRRLREATVALADGNLDARIGDSLGSRRDELGMLGRDFDTMAEKLQRAAEQQIELSRNISHELRSPLARIRVAVELARRKAGELPEFERLETDTERLDSLIGQILSYTRLDAESGANEEPIDMHDLISEVVENVNFEYKGKRSVAVEWQAENAVAIMGRRGALVSAVENILRNAVKHSPDEAEVTIRAYLRDGKFVIEVTDEGPGVAAADLPRIFEPFFRTQASAEQDGNGGTGLGLAIAKRAVELHDGHIEARTGDSGGLLVRISLPLGR
jgi:two-component system sensor histidine kinase CpxA